MDIRVGVADGCPCVPLDIGAGAVLGVELTDGGGVVVQLPPEILEIL